MLSVRALYLRSQLLICPKLYSGSQILQRRLAYHMQHQCTILIFVITAQCSSDNITASPGHHLTSGVWLGSDIKIDLTDRLKR